MSFVHFLIAWANAPFTIVGGIAVVFAMLQVSGLLGLLAGDHEGDHDVDGGDHDADADADGDGDHAGWSEAVFGALGVGRIPLSLIWQTFCVVFAVTGIALNTRYLGTAGPPPLSLLWTLPSATFAGAAVVAMVTRLFAPVFATKAQEATSRAELVGLDAVVISSKVTAEFGEVRIRDKSGHDLRVVCRLAPGYPTPKEHQRVVIVDYEGEAGWLLVAPIGDAPADGVLDEIGDGADAGSEEEKRAESPAAKGA